ncbi:hypothetical protein PABG_11783 [Paracoccidioides brasiliensis Pb03]|nr:hypothetical protein PABG_11783 [Paracoccidioides brasiliensis Pb03]
MASKSSTRPEGAGLAGKEQGAGEDTHHSSSHQCTQTSTEKYMIAIAEVWRNKSDQYTELQSLIILYDCLKVEGVLSTVSMR